MAITLFGIKNCDTVKKARKHLEAAGVPFDFHDFKSDGLEAEQFDAWLQAVPLDTLINKRGTTWRKLPESDRESLTPESANALACANPSLIKRPVVDWGDAVTVGFDAADWTARITRTS